MKALFVPFFTFLLLNSQAMEDCKEEAVQHASSHEAPLPRKISSQWMDVLEGAVSRYGPAIIFTASCSTKLFFWFGSMGCNDEGLSSCLASANTNEELMEKCYNLYSTNTCR